MFSALTEITFSHKQQKPSSCIKKTKKKKKNPHRCLCFACVSSFCMTSPFSSTARGEEKQQRQHRRADCKCHPAAGLHRRPGCGCVVGADGLQWLAVQSAPQEEAAGTLHHFFCLYPSRWAGRLRFTGALVQTSKKHWSWSSTHSSDETGFWESLSSFNYRQEFNCVHIDEYFKYFHVLPSSSYVIKMLYSLKVEWKHRNKIKLTYIIIAKIHFRIRPFVLCISL